ncbi:MAG: hypothetical protein NUW01_13535, partial [Gemmatimonadaceae bacterium]|nr:hypothetical protein [Gemmatimonadaceae bacterium]
MTLYKVLGKNGEPIHGGTGKWNLPSHGRPGKWMPVVNDIKACERGYHVVNDRQLIGWLEATIYEVEVRGERIDQDDKSCVSEARLVRKVTTWDGRNARPT